MRTLLTISFCLFAAPVFAQSASNPITVATNDEEGAYLVDGTGLSLYLFKADTQGSAGQPAVSACSGECLNSWPALTVEGAPIGTDLLDQSLLGTIARAEGVQQVTYNGWPLYYFVDDYAPGDINGDDIESFGEDWYLIGPAGDRARKD